MIEQKSKVSSLNSSYDIGFRGEIAVEQWLRNHGLTVLARNTRLPGATDLIASGPRGIMRIQVKSAEWPTEPGDIGTGEHLSLFMAAAQSGAQAWVARVQFFPYSVTPEITWEQIR